MQELKKMKNWICWKYRKDRKTGRLRKVPVAASGKPTGADDKHSGTWVTYEEAVQAVKVKGFDGVGFVLPEGCFLLDVDHRDLNDPLTRKLLDRFSSYIEYSVSGTGIHIIGKCDLSRIPLCTNREGELKLSPEFYQKNSKTELELYIGGLTNRYATFSGNIIRDLPILDCTEAVLDTLDQDMRKSNIPAADQELPDSVKMTEDELDAEAFDIVATLRRQKNSAKFRKLYDDGDISDYPSGSEADLGLCCMIAYRAGNNPTLIEKIFNGSALCRDKWTDREDYREMTIHKAIACCDGRFHPSKMKHPVFVVFSDKGVPSLEPSLLAEYIRREVDYILVRDDALQMTMIYVYENGCYHQVNKESFQTVIKKPVMEFDPRLVRMPKINEAYNQLMTDPVTITQDDLNADENMINFKNGLLYFTPEGLDFRPHSPEVYSTIQIPCNWNCDPVRTPVFDRYMEQLTGSDEQVIRLLLEVGGVVISNVKGWHLKQSLFLVGPGDTGKTVYKTLLEKILGKENCTTIDLKTIDARFGTSMLHGKRLAGSSELSFAKVNEINTFKALTGGDTVFMEFKNEQGFTGRFDGFLIFCMNRLPFFGGDNGKWVYERIIPVVCKNVIPKDQQDKLLIDKLYAEREGICYQFVMALLGVKANGFRFHEPESVIAERKKYMSENNSVIGFFTECMVRKDNGKLASHNTVSQIYSVYRDYCNDNNNGYRKTLKEFKTEIAEYLGISTEEMLGHNDRGTCFKRYDLSKEAEREFGFLFA